MIGAPPSPAEEERCTSARVQSERSSACHRSTKSRPKASWSRSTSGSATSANCWSRGRVAASPRSIRRRGWRTRLSPRTSPSPATCASCRGISSALRSARATSRMRRRTAGPPTARGAMSRLGKSRTASRPTTGSSTRCWAPRWTSASGCATATRFCTRPTPSPAARERCPSPTTQWCAFRPAGAWPSRASTGSRHRRLPSNPIRPRAARGCSIRQRAKTPPACRWPTAASPTSPAIPSPSGTRIS